MSMDIPKIIFLWENQPYLDWPNSWPGWAVLVGSIVLLTLVNWNWRQYNRAWSGQTSKIFLYLVVLVPIMNFLPAIDLSQFGSIGIAFLSSESASYPLSIFGSVPWFFAAGMLGPGPAAILAALSGLIFGLWGSHNPFLIAELATFATLLGVMLRQSYRTIAYRSIRHPIVAGSLLCLIYPLIYLFDKLMTVQELPLLRLEVAISQLPIAWISFSGSILVAAVLAEGFAFSFPETWGWLRVTKPSPAESKLETRFLFSLMPLVFVLLAVLILMGWFVAARTSRQMLERIMKNPAEIVASSVPYFLELGQNNISELAKDSQMSDMENREALDELLALDIQRLSYFNQLILVNSQGEPVAGQPSEEPSSMTLTPEELEGVRLSPDVPTQPPFSVKPGSDSQVALISFIAPVYDSNGIWRGALVGRTALEDNLQAISIKNSLDNLSHKDIGGEGMLIDEDGFILYHPDRNKVMTRYTGKSYPQPKFFQDIDQDGSQRLGYYLPVEGRDWAVVMTVPTYLLTRQAVENVILLLLVLLVVALIATLLFRQQLRKVTASLHGLAVQADRMTQGDLDVELSVNGEDEVAQLGRAFEKMRGSLKARLEELNRLLLVSKGVASSLEWKDSLQPVLDSSLVTGASSARIVLVQTGLPDMNGGSSNTLSYGSGVSCDAFRYLDEQVLALMRQRDKVMVTNFSRPRLFSISPGHLRPEAILAFPLRDDTSYYGAFWLAYNQPRRFSEEEVRFQSTLASQASIAAANGRLFSTAEIGRQRLEAILASTPDLVLVTDHQDRLLLANPAACKVFEINKEASKGKFISQVIMQEEVLDLLRLSDSKQQTTEISSTTGQIFLATASTIETEGGNIGRVCLFRDITELKQVDTLRTEFVSTVSHDLRSPLALVRGYTGMLKMVGELNEQQNAYLDQIVNNIDNMSRLVNNILDLRRMESGVGLQLDTRPIREVVQHVVESLRSQATQKRVQLEIEVPQEELPDIEADQALLDQALQNLVENSIKFTEVGGKVTIGLDLQPARVIFRVRDTGIGIAPADQARLFERFYRSGGKGVTVQRTSGLGLSIVKSVADRHKGQVWVDSQLGKGSTFFLELPLKQH